MKTKLNRSAPHPRSAPSNELSRNHLIIKLGIRRGGGRARKGISKYDSNLYDLVWNNIMIQEKKKAENEKSRQQS